MQMRVPVYRDQAITYKLDQSLRYFAIRKVAWILRQHIADMLGSEEQHDGEVRYVDGRHAAVSAL